MSPGARSLAGLGLLLLAACSPQKPPPDRLVLHRAGFAELPGWAADEPAAILPALALSCRDLIKTPAETVGGIGLRPEDWQGICAELPDVQPDRARAFIERRFVPFHAADNDQDEGLFTGYYEAELHGSRRQSARYAVPLYRRPADLVSVDLGKFRPSLKGERLAGRLAAGRLVPYASRDEIDKGALAGKGLELVWVDSAVDAFFLAIQGSGRVLLDEGGTMRLGYDGDNGWPYVAIGRVLVERGVPKDEISMPFLRDWIGSHGDDGAALMAANPSYVFFCELDGNGPVGAEGVALTPDRSAAVDRRFVPYGLPLWVDAEDGVVAGGRLRRLFVAQDTGGAIRGPVRADLFFGYGETATRHAGLMKGTGQAWLLLPKAAADRAASGS